MPKRPRVDYETWKHELVNQPPPDPNKSIDDIMREIGMERADGSYESLYEHYAKKAARSRARRRTR